MLCAFVRWILDLLIPSEWRFVWALLRERDQ